MFASACAALALVIAAPAAVRAPAASGSTRTRPVKQAPAAGRAPAPAEKKGRATSPSSALERARAGLAEVKRDPSKRRYRDRWERAIAALEKAARGRDAGPALLDAARGRYALYRFSQVDADRATALTLARRAQRAGAPQAAAFAAAVRKEMGEEERPQPVRAPARPPRLPAPAPTEAMARSERPGSNARAPATPVPGPAPSGVGPAAGGTSAHLSAAAGAAPGGAPAPPSGPAAGPVAANAADPAEEEAATDPILEEAVADDAEEAPAAPPSSPAQVSDVRSWSNGDYTRVAVYLSRPISYTREEIPAEKDRPRRLALDLKPALLEKSLARDVGDALVHRVRAAQHDRETVRVVLDLAGRGDELTIFSLEDPPRLIVDVGVREAQRQAQAQAQSREQARQPSQGAASQPQASRPQEEEGDGGRRPVRRIVVDAGHGGHDTGAIGPSRIREKDVTLAMARRLARRLRDRGYEVVLTRKDDTFVALEERTAIANARHGDLFVSLHANAHPRRDQRGVETYVLNVADTRYAARLAARENGALSDRENGQEVRRILTDLDAKTSAVASRRLAQAVQRELCAGVRGRFGEVRDLGVKSALFYVLLGARMPAVLVETSFISNRTEERRLSSPKFQDEVATAITRAVDGFAAREARVASAR